MASKYSQLVIEAARKQTATMIFLHGSGGSGSSVKDWIEAILGKYLSFAHIKLIFPSAPVQYYEPYKIEQPVWFNRPKLKFDSPEYADSVGQACVNVEQIVKQEVEKGVPLSRIIIGGFSMGGGLAFYCGFYAFHGVAGIFALSSFLSKNSIVHQALADRAKKGDSLTLPPLYQAHGDLDGLIPLAWGKDTFAKLKTFGINGSFKNYSNLDHSFDGRVLKELFEWVEQILPDN